jgi:hypothetical protein
MKIELTPTDGRKSFYKKAYYTVDHINDSYTYTLYSYNTKILSITSYDTHPEMFFIDRFWYGYSVTTMRHINSFVDTVDMIRGTCHPEMGGKSWWDHVA